MNRRDFIKTSAATTGAALTFGFEEQMLLAHAQEPQPQTVKPTQDSPSDMPTGKLGELTVSRLICGGNLISGIAHSRDLIYVSPLVKHYFTEDKILDTLQLAEQLGVNTVFLRDTAQSVNIMNRYWKEKKGSMQWIAQAENYSENGLFNGTKRAVDGGAAGVCIQGEASDKLVQNNQFDLLAKAYEYIQRNGVTAGIAAHRIEVLLACRERGLNPQFFMKTFNSKSYWSAGPQERLDSVWEETPQETAEFMKTCDVPWIAYKVLGAGAIKPEEGFKYAFEHGADFICVGMFDFQVKEDVDIAKAVLSGDLQRTRTWKA